MNTKQVVAISLVLVLLILVGSSFAYAKARPEGGATNAHSVVGSWIVTVIPDESTGMEPMINYSAISGDGTVVNSDMAGLASIGVWQRTGGDQFAIIFMGSELSGNNLIRAKIRGTITLGQDGESFSGPFVTEIFDGDGNLLFTMPGTIEGDRMHVEPLD